MLVRNGKFPFKPVSASLLYRVTESIIMSDNQVRLKGLDCLAKMANFSTASFNLFVDATISAIQSVEENHRDRNRVAFILRELCSRLSGERVLCSLSLKLSSLPVTSKTISIVQLLNLLIATSPQLYSLRNLLQSEDKEIFVSLWSCWTQCPVSSLSLALLAKRYSLAYQV